MKIRHGNATCQVNGTIREKSKSPKTLASVPQVSQNFSKRHWDICVPRDLVQDRSSFPCFYPMPEFPLFWRQQMGSQHLQWWGAYCFTRQCSFSLRWCQLPESSSSHWVQSFLGVSPTPSVLDRSNREGDFEGGDEAGGSVIWSGKSLVTCCQGWIRKDKGKGEGREEAKRRKGANRRNKKKSKKRI